MTASTAISPCTSRQPSLLSLSGSQTLEPTYSREISKKKKKNANPKLPISVGAHDSAFVGPLLTQNQNLDVSEQLALGIRFLQAQTHVQDDGIEMCHTDCLLLDAGPLADYLAPVKTFLDANADEVVTMLLTNGDAVAVADFGAAFEAAGLAQYAFAPAGALALDQWPTLQQMIDNGTRLVVWMGKQPINHAHVVARRHRAVNS